MPFQLPRPHHQHSFSEPHAAHDNYYSAANAIYSTGQTLSSAGAPRLHWQDPTVNPTVNLSHAPPTTASDNRSYQPLPNTNGSGTVIPYRPAPAAYAGGHPVAPPDLPSGPYTHGQRLAHPSGRAAAADDLSMNHQPGGGGGAGGGGAMSDIHHYGAPPAYAGEGLSIKIDPSTPQHPSSVASNPIPGTLQPGLASRPGPLTASNTAPSLPTLPQISTQMQQPPLSARPVTLNHTHSYSRSSPGIMDQPKYKPFANTPEQPKYAPPPGAAYLPQTPQGPSSYSPLGLADIRPRTEANFAEIPFSPTIVQDTETGQYSQTSSYGAPWPIYAVDWCKWPPRANSPSAGKVAVGSYLEDNHNYIQILDTQWSPADLDNPHGERSMEFVKTAEATHAYPVTRILWEPPSSNKQTTDLLATSGDHLRLWSLPNDQLSYPSNSISRSVTSKSPSLQRLSPLALLSNSKSPEHTAPITSLDWNVVQPSLIITSSIDTTCTIWDIPTLTAKTQLIAHDKEVYDVRFCASSVDVFVSCGADGSVRMFDLRSLEHSTIIYEPSDKQQEKNAQLSDPLSTSPTRGAGVGNPNIPFPPPLLRIAASPHDAHLLATFSQDSSIIRVLDVRQPGQALLELKGHSAPITCIDWSHTQRGMLASGADDCCVLLWDLMNSANSGPLAGGPSPAAASGGTGTAGAQERGPSAVWDCTFEVANLSWAPAGGALGVCGGKRFWSVQF